MWSVRGGEESVVRLENMSRLCGEESPREKVYQSRNNNDLDICSLLESAGRFRVQIVGVMGSRD